MKPVRRFLLLASIFCLLSGITSLTARAQAPDHQYDPIFAKAAGMEIDQPGIALDGYAKIKGDSKDPNVQAEALLRSGLLGYNAMNRLPDDLSRLSGDARTEKEQSLLGVARRAHDAVKTLLQNLENTPAAIAAKKTIYGPKQDLSLLFAIEAQIDHQNAVTYHFWNRISYQVVDRLVALTGRIPALSYWLALLLIALIVKGLTFPLTLKMYRSQREMQRIQPIMKELQERYANDKVKLNEETMKAYKEHGVNPFASCLPMFIQLPFLWWVYHTIQLYEFHFIHGKFLWIGSPISFQYPHILGTNMGQFDIPLLCLYAGSNYLTMRLTPSTDPQAEQTQKSMALMMTIMMLFMFLNYRWSGAFIFYWLVLNFISTAQQYYCVYLPNKKGKAAPLILAPETPGGGRPDRGSTNGSGKARPSGSTTATMNPPDSGKIRPRRKKR